MYSQRNKKYEEYPLRKIGPCDLPFLLNEIPDKPKLLYIRGEVGVYEELFPQSTDTNAAVGRKFLSVVGSRRHSVYGKEVCEKLIAGLARYPVVIVSGMAFGIDDIAHKAALNAGLKTIAVPGSGLDADVLYPKSHFALACHILNADGLLLSEYEPSLRSAPWTFPRRNRLMAGLSHATLVIEAEKESGTRITARLAADYNRDVMAVPGSIFSQNTSGAHDIINQGARLVTSSKDILQVLGILKEDTAANNGMHNATSKGPAPYNKERYYECSPQEHALLLLLNEPLSRSKLIEKSGLDISELNSLLGLLELKGLIKDVGGLFFLNHLN